MVRRTGRLGCRSLGLSVFVGYLRVQRAGSLASSIRNLGNGFYALRSKHKGGLELSPIFVKGPFSDTEITLLVGARIVNKALKPLYAAGITQEHLELYGNNQTGDVVNELLEQLKLDFQSEEARYAYAESVANAYVSEQTKRLREDRGLSQEELAVLIGTKQSGVSRLQSRDYSAWKVETLHKLAKAFGVRLRISFEEFGTIIDDVAGFKQGNLVPRKFAEDPAFNPSPKDSQSLAVR